MVNEPVRPLLALGLAGLERAKTLFVHRLLWHTATLGLLIAAACAVTFLHDTQYASLALAIEVATTGAAVFTEWMAFRTHHAALGIHSFGRQVMRRVMLLDALQPEGAVEYLPVARELFPEPVRRATEDRINNDPLPGPEQDQLRRYYASDRAPGPERLRDHLLESAMFSQRLYQVGFKFSVTVLGVFLLGTAVVLALMLTRGFGPHGHWGELALRLLIAVLTILPASQELDHALLYRMVSERLKDLIRRVELLWDPAIGRDQLGLRLTADVGDYGANTTFAPPIRTCVYKWLDPELNEQVRARLEALNKRASPGEAPPVPPTSPVPPSP